MLSHKKLCSRLFRQKLNFTGKNSKIAFCATLGGLRGNVHGSSMACWKARGRFSISANWTFSPALTVEALWANIGRFFRKGGWSFRAQISGGRGVVHQRLWSPCAITGRCLRDPTFSRFDRMPACDTQTYEQTQRHAIMAITRASLAPCG